MKDEYFIKGVYTLGLNRYNIRYIYRGALGGRVKYYMDGNCIVGELIKPDAVPLYLSICRKITKCLYTRK